MDIYWNLKNSKIPHFYEFTNEKVASTWEFAVYSVSLPVPSKFISQNVPPKSIHISPIVPGETSTYIKNEKLYFEHLQESMFFLSYRCIKTHKFETVQSLLSSCELNHLGKAGGIAFARLKHWQVVVYRCIWK